MQPEYITIHDIDRPIPRILVSVFTDIANSHPDITIDDVITVNFVPNNNTIECNVTVNRNRRPFSNEQPNSFEEKLQNDVDYKLDEDYCDEIDNGHVPGWDKDIDDNLNEVEDIYWDMAEDDFVNGKDAADYADKEQEWRDSE